MFIIIIKTFDVINAKIKSLSLIYTKYVLGIYCYLIVYVHYIVILNVRSY